jgi:hypothetical protein
MFILVSYEQWQRRGLSISRLSGRDMSPPFEDVATEACAQLPPEQRLLSDALIAVASTRRSYQGVDPPSDFAVELSVGHVMDGTELGAAVGRDTISAMTTVYRQALREKAGITNEEDDKTFVSEVVTDDELRTIIPQKVTVSAANLRQDIFLNSVPHLLSYEDGKLTFRREGVLTPEQSKERSKTSFAPRVVLHEQALGCPAVQVEGLVADVRTSIPEIVIKAQAIIKERQTRGDY